MIRKVLRRPASDSAEFVRRLVGEVRAHRITKEQAILELDEETFERLTKSTLARPTSNKALKSGIAICSGVAVGKVYFSAQKCAVAAKAGESAILLTNSITAEDINAFGYVQGILSLNDEPTSHAAIIARAMDKPFISGLSGVSWTVGKGSICLGAENIEEGEWLSIDAFEGILIRGEEKVQKRIAPEEFKVVLGWLDEAASISVHGNADTPEEAQSAIENGACGVECRTEYMFFKPDRLNLFRQMILAKSESQRDYALSKLLPLQRADFIKLYEVMGDRPIAIRLLDPPLHEFLPKIEETKRQLAENLHVDLTWIEHQVAALQEVNPMMGHRGVRLLITHPAIAVMQVRAVFEAALEMARRGKGVIPRILLPMVIDRREVVFIKRLIKDIYQGFSETKSTGFNYHIGAMIETPRAALTAAQIASEVDFISFGTNDLTAQTFGFSRGDVLTKFLSRYLDENILDFDPFYCLDEGVATLVSDALGAARKINPRMHASLCGEQGGEETTIGFCTRIGLNAVSCSPPRIPIVKLFAAQAAIRQLASANL